MRIYLSVPIIANRNLARTQVMARAIADSGHEVSSPWVLGETGGRTSVNVFNRDREGVENSDAIVADVSLPSTGVGIEVMAAHNLGRRVIVVAKKGSVVSKMLGHMEPKEAVEFEEDADLYDKLRLVLEAESRV